MKTRLENRAIHTLIWGDLEGIHILNLNAIGHSQLFFFIKIIVPLLTYIIMDTHGKYCLANSDGLKWYDYTLVQQ